MPEAPIAECARKPFVERPRSISPVAVTDVVFPAPMVIPLSSKDIELRSPSISRTDLLFPNRGQLPMCQSSPRRELSSGTTRCLPRYKIVLLGDCGVGKSNILTRFASNQFSFSAPPTIGAECVTREIDLLDRHVHWHTKLTDKSVSSSSVLVDLWDTSGQERFNALTNGYFRNARGIVLVYDVTRPNTLYSLAGWIERARHQCDANCVFVVVGNKTDLTHSIEVSEEEATVFAHKMGCRHFFASAMSGEGVPNCFFQLLLSIHSVARLSDCVNVTSAAHMRPQTGDWKRRLREHQQTQKRSNCCSK